MIYTCRSVKNAPENKESAARNKTQAWLDSLPDDAIVIVSDSDEEEEEVDPGKNDKANPGSKPSDTLLDLLKEDTKTASGGANDPQNKTAAKRGINSIDRREGIVCRYVHSVSMFHLPCKTFYLNQSDWQILGWGGVGWGGYT